MEVRGGFGVRLADGHHPIDTDVGQHLGPAVRPRHHETVDARRRAEAKVLTIVHGRHEAAIGRVIEILPSAVGRQHERRTESAAVWRFTLEHDRKEVCGGILLDVFVNRRGRIDVVHDEIELPVVVQIDVGRAVRVARLCHAPRLAHVVKRQIAVVAKHEIGYAVTAERPQLLSCRCLVVGSARREDRRLIIEVVRRLGVSVRDEEILAAVVVEIGEQRAPTPLRGRRAGQIRDFAEDHVAGGRHAVAELQRIGVVVVPKTSAPLFVAVGIRQVPTHAFALLGRRGQHVHLHDIGPSVVIEIRDIDAHTGDARVFQRARRLVGKRAVPVVDVERVVGGYVVGDVDVGPAIAVHIGDDHPQSVPDLAQDPGFPGDVGEGAVAIVAVQRVPALGAVAP